MSTPVLATKLFAPTRRPQAVARPRLIEQLDGTLEPDRRLTLLSGPAGFGKTTVLGDWLAHLDELPTSPHVGWLSLDAGDNDVVRLLAHATAALRGAGLEIDSGALESMGSGTTTAALTAIVNDVALAGELMPGERWVLVLDDYQVIESAEVHEAVSFLLDHLPDQLHLVMATRSDPPLPLARLRARGQLTEVRAADLRFTPVEAREFLNQAMGLELSPADVDALDTRTEGWVAGLQLAALSLRGIPEPGEAAAFIEAFTGSNRFVIDYLADEVLARQPAEVREFLLRTAVLERLNGPLCDVVTGRADSTRMLEDLERGNLFVVPLDADRSWFRYHHLFGDVLQARLLAEHPDEVPELHERASAYYESLGFDSDAVRHALAAEDFDRAARLIEVGMSEVSRTRQDALLASWARALPDSVVRRNPVLSILSGWASLAAGDLDALESRLDDAEAALDEGAEHPDLAATWADTDDLRTAPATISVYRASLAQARGDTDGTVRHARRVMELAGPEDHFLRGAGGGFLGLAAFAAGDVQEAQTTSPRRSTACAPPGGGSTRWTARSCSPTCGSPRDDPAAQEGSTRRGCRPPSGTASRIHGPPPTCTSVWPSSTVSSMTSPARKRISRPRGCSLNEPPSPRTGTDGPWSWPRCTPPAGTSMPRCACSTRPRSSTGTAIYPDVRPIAAMRARLQITSGDLESAASWAEAQGLSVEDEPVYLHEYEHLTLVRLLLAGHRMRPLTPRSPPHSACSSDCTRQRRTPGGTAASSRSACSRPSPTTPPATCRRHWPC